MKDRLREIDLEVKTIEMDIVVLGYEVGEYSNMQNEESFKQGVVSIINWSKKIIKKEDDLKLLKKERKELVVRLMSE